jgi:hypothetical protein
MVSILLYIGIFFGGCFVGTIVGIMVHAWVVSHQSFSGTMRVIRGEDKTVYSLELEEDPEMLAYKPEVIFRVITTEVDSNRE